MWLNPSADGETAKPSGDAAISGFSSGPITHIVWRQAVMDPDDILRVDATEMGTAFSDVVPLVNSAGRPGTGGDRRRWQRHSCARAEYDRRQFDHHVCIARDPVAISSPIPPRSGRQNVTGGVGPGDLVAASDGKSAVFTAQRTARARPRHCQRDQPRDSGTLTVVAGPASRVQVETQPDGSGVVVPAQSVPPGTGR